MGCILPHHEGPGGTPPPPGDYAASPPPTAPSSPLPSRPHPADLFKGGGAEHRLLGELSG